MMQQAKAGCRLKLFFVVREGGMMQLDFFWFTFWLTPSHKCLGFYRFAGLLLVVFVKMMVSSVNMKCEMSGTFFAILILWIKLEAEASLRSLVRPSTAKMNRQGEGVSLPDSRSRFEASIPFAIDKDGHECR